MDSIIFNVTPQVEALAAIAEEKDRVLPDLYTRHNVMRGLRDLNGFGVPTGLTNISEVTARTIINGERVPCPGELFYRGYNVNELIDGFMKDGRLGFEEITYLLLIGELPTPKQLAALKAELAERRSLPSNFLRDVIMKAPSKDIMINLSKSVLTLYSYDDEADNVSLPNVMRQCLNLISQFPMLAVYSYHALKHADGGSLYIHQPDPELSTAENILRMLRPDMAYTPFEAKVLDMALVLHMEHGGGNNSTFTTRVVSSSGTDTYSAVAAALGSLKGPKHGGANIKVVKMFEDMKAKVKDWTDDEEISAYLHRILAKEEFDKSGLIYGVGHAIYSVSDPRAEAFKKFVSQLAAEKGRSEEFGLYAAVERLAPQIIGSKRKMYKGVNTNVDFYSGFVYSMLDLPLELYTPMFAVARIVGWSAHRLEELVSAEKIIRPAYIEVMPRRSYLPMEARTEE